jgi:hypothetical protein
MEQREGIKFFKLGKTPTENFEMLETVCGDKTISRSSVSEGFNCGKFVSAFVFLLPLTSSYSHSTLYSNALYLYHPLMSESKFHTKNMKREYGIFASSPSSYQLQGLITIPRNCVLRKEGQAMRKAARRK